MNLRDLRNRLGTPAPSEGDEMPPDFGLGDKVARRAGTRLINADGSFNVVRRGRSLFAPYQRLVELSWWKFLGLTLLTYVLCNLAFALLFYLMGPEALTSVPAGAPAWSRFLHAFFFSVQTFTTVGYGHMSPLGLPANALAALLTLFGWVALALVTGLVFARFSRPGRVVGFSEHAVVATLPSGQRSLQFRIANRRDNNLINVRARVVLTWLEATDGAYRRHFRPLKLERDYVPLFPLNWTVVHPIDAESPLHGWDEGEYRRRHSELLIMVEGYDSTYSNSIHAKNSYVYDELRWNAHFVPMYRERAHTTELFLDLLGELEEE